MRILSEQIETLRVEIAALQSRLDTLEDRWKDAVVTMMWKGSTYNHARYYRRLEKQSLNTKLKRRQKKLNKLLKQQ